MKLLKSRIEKENNISYTVSLHNMYRITIYIIPCYPFLFWKLSEHSKSQALASYNRDHCCKVSHPVCLIVFFFIHPSCSFSFWSVQIAPSNVVFIMKEIDITVCSKHSVCGEMRLTWCDHVCILQICCQTKVSEH